MKISTALINRKRIIFLAVAMAIGTAAMSQISIGVHATGNLASANTTVTNVPGDVKKTSKVLPGAGVLVDFSVNENFSIQSGADYRKNGVSLKFDLPVEGMVMKAKMTTDLNYIQVPVNFVYKTSTSPVQFYAGIGGFAGFGISGKTKIEASIDGQVVMEEESDAFKKEEDGGSEMKRFDFGGQALAGVKVGKFYGTISYQAGFANLVKGDESDDKYRNRGAQLTIGYIIW